MPVKGYKGFDKDLKCNGMKYELGKEFSHDGPVKACSSGLHFCEHPLDVLGYYAANGDNRFAEVEGYGDIDKKGDDTKVACSKLRIGAEIGIRGLIDAAVKITFDRADWSEKKSQNDKDRGAASATGYSGAASATGYSGAASATGYSGAASATGDSGAASATGKYSVACGLGIKCKARAFIGSAIVLVEREKDDEGFFRIKNIKSAVVDGVALKDGVFYVLKDGEFVEVAE